jgi:hypothetical protein
MSESPSSIIELDVLPVESRKRSVTAEVVTPTKSGAPSLSNCSLGRPSSAPLTRSRNQITTGRIQFLALCFCLFLAGWNDGSTGPLLLRIQDAYHVWFHDNCSIANWTYSQYCSGKFSCCFPYVRVRVCCKHLAYFHCSVAICSKFHDPGFRIWGVDKCTSE